MQRYRAPMNPLLPLMQNPEIMLADEPVSSLDPATSHSVLKYLDVLNKEDGITILCSLHFLSLARTYADRVIALKDGRIEFRAISDAAIVSGLIALLLRLYSGR